MSVFIALLLSSKGNEAELYDYICEATRDMFFHYCLVFCDNFLRSYSRFLV